MRRAAFALVCALIALGFARAAIARPIEASAGSMSPGERGYIYKNQAEKPTLDAGTLIAIGLGIGVGVLVIVVLTRKQERFTSSPTPPPPS